MSRRSEKDNPVVPVIDLFAGPGGLSEGFHAHHDGRTNFEIALSVEMEESAHRTLELRSFFRQFPEGEVPDEYYRYVCGENITREDLFNRFPEGEIARQEAWKAELGKVDDSELDARIESSVDFSRPWILVGGPPCQAYSMAGRSRYAVIRRENPSIFDNDHRHRLYEEYLRILAKYRPPIFVMENVKGILTSKLRNVNIFSKILEDLSQPHLTNIPYAMYLGSKAEFAGYSLYSLVVKQPFPWMLKPSDFVIEAEKYGVPQTRHRVILLGIRSEYDLAPAGLLEQVPAITAGQVIGDLPEVRSALSREPDSYEQWKIRVNEIDEATSNDEISSNVRTAIRSALHEISSAPNSGGRYVPGDSQPAALADWYCDPRLKGALNHEAKSHMTSDLHRYLFAACFAEEMGESPKLRHFPDSLLPNHRNAKTAAKTTSGVFNDRFRVQLKDKPATTVVSHIAKDGHYYIHYDGRQCRSLTVREAARLQTFPDNYFFEGSRTDQYRQVGNAVPPLLARQIAGVVSDTLVLIRGKGDKNNTQSLDTEEPVSVVAT